MNIAVLYATRTGHSTALAQAIADALGVTSQNAAEKPALGEVDLLLVVSGIYAGKTDARLMDYVRALPSGQVKRAALLTSSMGRKQPDKLRQALTDRGITVQPEEYTCMGSFLFFGKGHPNQEEIAGAVQFARAAAVKE